MAAHDCIAPLQVGIANVHAEADAAGNAVDCTGKYVTDTHGRDGVHRAAGASRRSQSPESISAAAHKASCGRASKLRLRVHRSLRSLSADSRERRFLSRCRANLLAFQQRALLDVQFDECLVVAVGSFTSSSSPVKSCSAANLVRASRHRCPSVFSRLGRKRSRQKPAAEASDSKTRGLFGGEDEQLDRTARRNPLCCSARIASSPPSTPTTPSYLPAFGMASICEPVPTAAADGSEPSSARTCFRRHPLAPRGPASAARLHPSSRFQIGAV